MIHYINNEGQPLYDHLWTQKSIDKNLIHFNDKFVKHLFIIRNVLNIIKPLYDKPRIYHHTEWGKVENFPQDLEQFQGPTSLPLLLYNALEIPSQSN